MISTMFYLMMKVNVSKDVHKRLERKALRPLLCDILYLFGKGNTYYQGKNGMSVATMSVLAP